MKIRDVMTKSPVGCNSETGVEQVARHMVQCDCGSIPVLEGERVIGIVTDRDIVVRSVAAGKCPLELTAKDLMSHPVAVVSGDADISVAFKALESNQIRRLPVVDGSNRLIGMVSTADLARSARAPESGELLQSISEGADYGHR